MPHILIIEDEPDMARGLLDILEYEGYGVTSAGSGEEGLSALKQRQPDCVILDLMLPDMSGYQVCEQIRRQGSKVPIIILTAKSQDYDKIRGFQAGTDDYLTKPFSVGELLARVKAVLRRSHEYGQEPEILQVGPSRIDVKHFTIRRGQEEISLSYYEVELLKLLHANANQPVSRDEILDKVWGTEKYPSNRTVDNFIVKLRKKLEADYRSPKHILTIYGVGYKLSP
jgi:DNA-binding response OmpR family regulator